jgi:hypothetical protein
LNGYLLSRSTVELDSTKIGTNNWTKSPELDVLAMIINSRTLVPLRYGSRKIRFISRMVSRG